jgi:hypothetical protein
LDLGGIGGLTEVVENWMKDEMKDSIIEMPISDLSTSRQRPRENKNPALAIYVD